MIQITFTGSRGSIRSVKITGHAGYDRSGRDLVCAAVSSIGIGTLNALDEMVKDHCDLELSEDIKITVRQSDEKVQTILEVLDHQLMTIALKYPQYVKITRKE